MPNIETVPLGDYTRGRDEITITEEHPAQDINLEGVVPLTTEYADGTKKAAALQERLQTIRKAVAEYQALDEAQRLPDDDPAKAETVAARENDFGVLVSRADIKQTTDAQALFELNHNERASKQELVKTLQDTYTILFKQAELLTKGEKQLKQGANIHPLLEDAAFIAEHKNLLQQADAAPESALQRIKGWNQREMSTVHAELAEFNEDPREIKVLQAMADAAAERQRIAEERRQRDLEAAAKISKFIQEELSDTPPAPMTS